MNQDQRRRIRVPANFSARILTGDKTVDVETINVSLKGMLVTTVPDLDEGDSCRVRLALAEDAAIEVDCRVARVGEGESAIDFETMDLESFGHLRRMVHLLSGQPEAIDAELGTPAFGEGDGRDG
jgi:hypothetical protein